MKNEFNEFAFNLPNIMIETIVQKPGYAPEDKPYVAYGDDEKWKFFGKLTNGYPVN